MEGIQDKQKDNTALSSKIRKGISLVDFDAAWCIPCREQRPIFERLAKKYEGKVVFHNLDVDKDPDQAMSLGIASIPTMIVFKNGNELQRFIGLQSEDTIVQSLEVALETSD